ncbi:MAG TPA: hypothetical protein VFP05_11540, partial [Thermomicrobiales bacterium]|nr:hypothetical protein [Thermomicrobiales bacterium]
MTVAGTRVLVRRHTGRLDAIDIVSGPLFQFVQLSDSPEPGGPTILIDGYILPIPSEYAEGVTGTVVVLNSGVEDVLNDGFVWREVYENR